MKILAVFNNNVVLARGDDGGELVLTGRGLGFQKKPGQTVDRDRVARTFVPSSDSSAQELAEYVAQIPPEYLSLATEALQDAAHAGLEMVMSTAVVIALADHLSFAVTRIRRGLEVEYPVRAEIVHLYPKEFAAAQRIVEFTNSRIEEELPPEEVVPVTLHLVNAGFATMDLSKTFQMTELLGQIFDVIEGAYGTEIDRHGIASARFITHLRYFFIRAAQDEQGADDPGTLVEMVRQLYPDAHTCALRIQNILELRLGRSVTSDEVAYLSLHVARLTTPTALSDATIKALAPNGEK
ncbi:MAG TPA: PRD domain-containing protein [Actinomycetaceae bacterium]|nr:PRD domain-containing protein [Actinomycetaceae bacterium]